MDIRKLGAQKRAWLVFCLILCGCSAPGSVKDNAAGAAQFKAERMHPGTHKRMLREMRSSAHLYDGTIWPRIRNGYGLTDYQSAEIDRHIEWFQNNQGFLERSWQRGEPYLYYILEELDKRHMPTEIALLPVVESGFQYRARSPSAAAGLWQFIPATGQRFGLRQDGWTDQRLDVIAATRAALDYLQELEKMFDGDWLLALASYNAGENRIKAEVLKNRNKNLPTHFSSLSLRAETSAYVPQLLALARIVRDPERYGFNLPPIQDQPYFEIIEPDSQVELQLVEKLCPVTREEINRLNPALHRSVTPPNGPHRILIPTHAAAQLRLGLNRIPAQQRIASINYPTTSTASHLVKSGDTLNSIARKHGTTVAALQQANRLSGTLLKVGDHLTIPQGKIASAAPSDCDDAYLVHKVCEGDSLWKLASKYGVPVDSIQRCNTGTSAQTLKIGSELRILSRGNSGVQIALGSPPNNKGKFLYQIQKGDSLHGISRRFGVSVDDLEGWNRKQLKGKKYLQPGEHITVFRTTNEQS